jgi:hypothetical protein
MISFNRNISAAAKPYLLQAERSLLLCLLSLLFLCGCSILPSGVPPDGSISDNSRRISSIDRDSAANIIASRILSSALQTNVKVILFDGDPSLSDVLAAAVSEASAVIPDLRLLFKNPEPGVDYMKIAFFNLEAEGSFEVRSSLHTSGDELPLWSEVLTLR